MPPSSMHPGPGGRQRSTAARLATSDETFERGKKLSTPEGTSEVNSNAAQCVGLVPTGRQFVSSSGGLFIGRVLRTLVDGSGAVHRAACVRGWQHGLVLVRSYPAGR
jgi:hypothetical protein